MYAGIKALELSKWISVAAAQHDDDDGWPDECDLVVKLALVVVITFK